MVYYIRFLKPPALSDLTKSTFTVAAVITITTDLGDIALPFNVELITQLIDSSNTSQVLEESRCQWQGGKRALTIFFTCVKRPSCQNIRVHVTTAETVQCLAASQLPRIFDIWSASFPQNVIGRSDPLVERRFHLSPEVKIRIWEETGNTIARHIWDAAVGCLRCFQSILLSDGGLAKMPALRELLSTSSGHQFNVVELGAGCGIAGIALAQMMPNCAVHLTDLAEAQDMLTKNVDIAQPATGSSLHQGLLRWGSELPLEMLDHGIELVLISDCTYNADSCSDLVQTLSLFANHCPSVKILVAMKRRHDAEALFEYKMECKGFHAIECTRVAIPHEKSDVDSAEPVVELYLYEHAAKAKS